MKALGLITNAAKKEGREKGRKKRKRKINTFRQTRILLCSVPVMLVSKLAFWLIIPVPFSWTPVTDP